MGALCFFRCVGTVLLISVLVLLAASDWALEILLDAFDGARLKSIFGLESFSCRAQAFLATTIISLLPCLILSLIPASSCHGESALLRVLLGFASGSLLGEALLHLVPHSLEHNSNLNFSLHESFLAVSRPLMAGMLVFYLVETVIRQLKRWVVCGESSNRVKRAPIPSKKKKCVADDCSTLSVSAYLNLMSDFVHNFLDGVAIGAAFANSPHLGVVTTLSIFFHEIPHEISDFAILVRCGYSKWRAMLLQLVTAVGALLGAACGLGFVLGDAAGNQPQWVLPFTAGGFLYIACVAVIPELLADQQGPIQSTLEIMGMVGGVWTMELLGNAHHHPH